MRMLVNVSVVGERKERRKAHARNAWAQGSSHSLFLFPCLGPALARQRHPHAQHLTGQTKDRQKDTNNWPVITDAVHDGADALFLSHLLVRPERRDSCRQG